MKFYQNKITKQIIGIKNMRELLTHPTDMSIKLGFKDYSYKVIYDAIYPNKLLGNGIVSFAIEHTFLTKNYKRIKKEIALNKYPNFKQYDYEDLVKEAKKKKISKLEVLKQQTI